MNVQIRAATPSDCPLILSFIRELAEYEKLAHEVVATEGLLREHLFGPRAVAEALIASADGIDAGFAVYFRNFSTFLGLPGIYLEDVYVRPAARGSGVGRALLHSLASLAVERGYGRVEWAVLDWNDPAIRFYRRIGAVPKTPWRLFELTGDALHQLAAAPRQPA